MIDKAVKDFVTEAIPKIVSLLIGSFFSSSLHPKYWLGLNTDDMKLITALIVAAFLAIPYWKGKYAHVKVPAGSANAGAKTGGDQDA